MSIVPKHIRALGVSIRRATDDDDPDDILEFSHGQSEARLSKQLQNDKQRSIVWRNREIKSAKVMMGRTKNQELKKQLKQKINKLENENRQEQRFMT